MERWYQPRLSKVTSRADQALSRVSIAVLAYMALSYGLFGIFANVALIVNVGLIFGLLSMIGATLTLPGIAGIVLTIGMAVDANVIVFERIRAFVDCGCEYHDIHDCDYSVCDGLWPCARFRDHVGPWDCDFGVYRAVCDAGDHIYLVRAQAPQDNRGVRCG